MFQQVVFGAVLAGGGSTRMGTPKALIEINGEAMVVRAVKALKDSGVEKVVVVGLSEQLPVAQDVDLVPDLFSAEGPLNGIITALTHFQAEAPDGVIATLPCDVITPSSDSIRALLNKIDDFDTAVPVVDDQPQWLHAVWNMICLPKLKTQFEKGIRSLHEVTEALDVVYVDDTNASAYADADSPSDLPH